MLFITHALGAPTTHPTPATTSMHTYSISDAQSKTVTCGFEGCTMSVNFTLEDYRHWSAVYLTVDDVYGDIDQSSEYIELYVNGSYVFICFEDTDDYSLQCSDRYSCVERLDITDELWPDSSGVFTVDAVTSEYTGGVAWRTVCRVCV